MDTAEVFKSGDSQAVRLPRDYRFDTDEVEIFRRGDEVVLRPIRNNLARAYDLICQLPNFDRADAPPQGRD